MGRDMRVQARAAHRLGKRLRPRSDAKPFKNDPLRYHCADAAQTCRCGTGDGLEIDMRGQIGLTGVGQWIFGRVVAQRL